MVQLVHGPAVMLVLLIFTWSRFHHSAPSFHTLAKTTTNLKKGTCYTHCSSSDSCFIFGYGSEKSVAAATGDFYVNTASSGSYCLQVAQPETEVSSSQKNTNGKVTVQIRSKDGTLSDKFVIADGKIKAGDVLSSWIEVPGTFNILEQRLSVILNYKRGGLTPTLEPKQLILNDFKILVTDKNLNTKAIDYYAVTLEAGTDMLLP